MVYVVYYGYYHFRGIEGMGKTISNLSASTHQDLCWLLSFWPNWATQMHLQIKELHEFS